jgi:hypothetical protein
MIKIPPFENNNSPMWARLQRRLVEAARAEAARQGRKLDAKITADAEKFFDAEAAKREALIVAMSRAPRCQRCNGDRFISGAWPDLPDEPCPSCNAGAPSGAERVRMTAMSHAQRATVIALEDLGPRCPNCGQWLSTRYSTGQPHVCSELPDTGHPLADLEEQARIERWRERAGLKAAEPEAAPTMQGGQPRQPIILGPASPAHASNQTARYLGPINWPNAPTGPARALALAWLLGAICGAYVGFLAGLLWLPS